MSSDSDLFSEALERPEAERSAYLSVRATDTAQRERIATLLRAHERTSSVLIPLVKHPREAGGLEAGDCPVIGRVRPPPPPVGNEGV